MTLDEILTALGEQTDVAAVVTGIKDKNQKLFQHIFDLGHGEATRKLSPKVEELTTKVTGLEKVNTDLTKQNEELGKTNPDVKVLQTTIVDLQKQVQDAKDGGVVALHGERRSTFLSEIKSDLVARGVDPVYAEAMMVRPDLQKRIRITKEGQREVLRKDAEIPLMPGEKPVIALLAEELVASVPPRFVNSSVDRGSGIKPGGQGGEQTTYLSTLKKDLVEQRKTEAAAKAGISEVQKRLGMAANT